MSLRATLVLLALLAMFGAAAFYVQGPGRADRSREHAVVFPGLTAGDVALIRATSATGEVLLSRGAGGWNLGDSQEAADTAAVEALLASLVEVRVGAVVSTNLAKQSVYETDPGAGIAVRLEAAGGKLLAAFVVGKRGPDFASCYLRLDGASEVLLVPGALRDDFSRPAESWRAPEKQAEAPEVESPAATVPPAGEP